MGTPLTKLATRVTAATFWYISLPSSAKQREIKKFYVFSRKWVHDDNFFFLFSYFDVVDSNLVPGQSPCEQNLRLSFSLLRRRKGGCAWSASALWSRRSPNFWTSQSCFVCFFQCKQPFSGKTDGYFSSPLHNETSSWRRDLLEAKHQLFSTRFFLSYRYFQLRTSLSHYKGNRNLFHPFSLFLFLILLVFEANQGLVREPILVRE